MKEITKLLTSALSAVKHGRYTTATKKTVRAAIGLSPELSELLFDLLGDDLYTDAIEYMGRVDRVRELREAIMGGYRAKPKEICKLCGDDAYEFMTSPTGTYACRNCFDQGAF